MTALSEAPTLFPSIGQRVAASVTSRLLVASLAVSAGIHFAVAYQHGGSGDHGRFFVAVGMAQAVLALLVSRRTSHRRLWATTALSVLLVGTWVAAKTALLPGITGPSTPAGLVDAAATVLEVMTGAAALVLLRRRRTPSPVRTNVAAVVALVALPALGLATLVDSHGARQDHVGEQPVRAAPAATPSVFGDLFDDHHAGATGHERAAPAHPREPGAPARPTDREGRRLDPPA